MSTPVNQQRRSGNLFDVLLFVLLALICLGGVISIFLSSSTGLALTEFLISFGGLVVSFLVAMPAILGRWQKMLQQRLATALRVIILLALVGTIALQLVIIIGRTPPSVPPTHFLSATITSSDGRALPTQQPVNIAVKQLPLVIAGTYASSGTGEVWAVVVDKAGQYYLQIPSVRFADGGQQGVWRAYNIFTNIGTISIDFIYMPQGESFFQKKAENHDFSAFSDLPSDARTLLRIGIQVTP